MIMQVVIEIRNLIAPAGVVAVEAHVHAPVASRVRVGAQGRVAARPEGAPVAVVVAALRAYIGARVGEVDATEAEAVLLEDRVGLAPPFRMLCLDLDLDYC
jgi:hypothetical protein